MIERKIYDVVERVSGEERSGSFGSHLLNNLFSDFAQDLGMFSGELWHYSRNESRRLELVGAPLQEQPPEWLQTHFKRHRKMNPFWRVAAEVASPAAVVTFGKKQRAFMVFHFEPRLFEEQHSRIEETVMLIRRC